LESGYCGQLDAISASSAARTARMLDRLEGLSVRGFFIVDRSIFPALLGHFLTYLVILIQVIT